MLHGFFDEDTEDSLTTYFPGSHDNKRMCRQLSMFSVSLKAGNREANSIALPSFMLRWIFGRVLRWISLVLESRQDSQRAIRLTASENPSEFLHFLICPNCSRAKNAAENPSENHSEFRMSNLCNARTSQFAHALSANYSNFHLKRIFGRILGISIELHQAKNAAQNESENHSEISVERSNWPPESPIQYHFGRCLDKRHSFPTHNT